MSLSRTTEVCRSVVLCTTNCLCLLAHICLGTYTNIVNLCYDDTTSLGTLEHFKRAEITAGVRCLSASGHRTHVRISLILAPLVITGINHSSQNQRVLGTGQLSKYPWITHDCVRALRNLTIRGGESGKTVVREATTEELVRVLPGVVDIVNKVLGEVAARAVRTWIEETWPSIMTDSAICKGR
jgi:hypothetical protein